MRNMPHTLKDLQETLEQGMISCASVVRYYLDRIEATKDLNIYVAVYAEEALARAAELDRRLVQGGPRGRLFGAVLSHKDVIAYAGHGLSAASKMLEGFESVYSATAIERVLAEDAILIGRVNCDEFAMGSTNEHSVYGPTKNGAKPDRVPGGSSGASAVAVQMATCLASLGSDTGGSVRQPAAFCGVFGLKPTYGRVSRHGLIAYGSSFDQIGVLANTPEDAGVILEVIAGPDEYDATASTEPVTPYTQQKPTEQARIAYWPEAIDHPQLDSRLRQVLVEQLEHWERAGHKTTAVSFPYLDFLVPAYYVLTTAEASANLSRYDGVRYGYRSPEARTLEEVYRKSRTEGFGAEVKRRIMLGAFVLSAGYYDAYYGKAQQVRRLISDWTTQLFQKHDFLLLPVTTGPPWPLKAQLDDPVAMYLADVFTVQANMSGIPGLAFPAGAYADGSPLGLQLLAAHFEEGRLLSFAQQYLPQLSVLPLVE